jgi:RND family efflux transporter MFP subunit
MFAENLTEPSRNQPSRRSLLLAAIVAAVVAGGVVVEGVVSRAQDSRELTQWTDQQAAPTVQLAKIDLAGGQQDLTLPGNIQPYYKTPIFARVSGYLSSWKEDIGAHVTAGQVLAVIDSPELDQQLAQAKADLATATANAQLASVTAARWTKLVQSQWVSQQAVDDKTGAAAATRAAMDSAAANVKRLEALESFKNITAPFDGTVIRRNTDVGALVNAGGGATQPLFDVADLHRVRIYVQVPQAFVARMKPGLSATFELPQYAGRQLSAVVVTTSNSMDPSSRTMQVELQADNTDGLLAGNSYCQVHFQLPAPPNVVRVPATALLPTNKGTEVAVLGGDGKVALKTITIGRDLGDTVEVTAGLVPDDRVIDSPPETLQAGDPVRLASTPITPTTAAARAPRSSRG